MKKFSKLAVCAFVLTFAVSAFAGEGKGTFTLHQDAVLNGETLKAGRYKVKWDEAGNVSLLSGKKVVTTTNAKIVPAKKGFAHSAAVMERQADGSLKLVELQLEGKKQSLQLSEGGSAGTASGANAQ